MPNQDNQNKNPVSVISPQSDLPPMPPAFQDLSKTQTQSQPPTSGAPAEKITPPANTPPVISSTPKKKFGGGRIIATILGVLLLIGGVGAGYVLTQQPQLFQQNASANCCRVGSTSSCSIGCKTGVKHCVSGDPSECVGQVNKGTWGGCIINDTSGCKTPPPACTSICAGKQCGAGDGCGNTCNNGSGCSYCSSATSSFCTSKGWGTCEADANGGHCTNVPGQPTPQPTGHPNPSCDTTKAKECGNNCIACGGTVASCTCTQSGYSCSASFTCIGSGLAGLYDPTKPSQCGNNCIYSGKTAAQCVCPTNQTCTSNFTCSGTGTGPDCGGAAANQPCTSGVDCHCQGGDACTSKLCQPDQHSSCTAQGRSWCVNQSGSGYTCCNAQYVCASGGKGCTPQTPPSNPPSNPPGVTASCNAVTAYSSTWTALTTAQLSAQAVGTLVNLCVTGTTSGGSFDKAMFKNNGNQGPEVTSKGQGAAAAAFCEAYTIIAGTNNVTAQIHHSSLGWSN